jgi:hypothetical protein
MASVLELDGHVVTYLERYVGAFLDGYMDEFVDWHMDHFLAYVVELESELPKLHLDAARPRLLSI